jgi:signal transduction histidine kinase
MDKDKVRKWVHDLNNRLGVVLASAELLQLEELPPKARERTKVIEQRALEIRQLIRELTDHLMDKP